MMDNPRYNTACHYYYYERTRIMIPLYLRGFIIGISIAAPVGPIGLLCIRRTLAEGKISGLVSGLGAASADGIYGIIAGFGLTFLSTFLVEQKTWLGLVGGLFLCMLGVRTFLSGPTETEIQNRGKGLAGNFFSTFLLTLSNPMTILSFTAIFAGLGLTNTNNNYISAALLVLGVFCGSALWWLFLSQAAGFFRNQITPGWMRWINRISGMVIFGFGIAALFFI
jgi:threonine/homoserine/homoserine lactone efflux protein